MQGHGSTKQQNCGQHNSIFFKLNKIKINLLFVANKNTVENLESRSVPDYGNLKSTE